jgi:hypothetical protein
MAGGAGQSATAEPVEEFLRSVGGHHPTPTRRTRRAMSLREIDAMS